MDLEKYFLDNDVIPYFQCIVDFKTCKIIGYEGFSKVGDEKITELLRFGSEQKKLWLVEKKCEKNIIKTAWTLGIRRNIFININAEVINDPQFDKNYLLDKLKKYSIMPEHVCLEFNAEDTKLIDVTLAAVTHFKNQGFKVALKFHEYKKELIDSFLECKPNVIKIVFKPDFENIVHYLAQYCFATNTLFLAEKIEHVGQLRDFMGLEVRGGQGFFISNPEIFFPKCSSKAYGVIAKNILLNQSSGKIKKIDEQHNFSTKNQRPISEIISYGETMLEEEMAVNAMKLFHNEINCPIITILDDKDHIKGILPRTYLLDLFSGQYGFGLYSRKKVSDVMQTDFLTVNKNEAVENVVSQATSREKDQVYSPIIIEDKGIYQGIVTIKDLMESIIAVEVTGRTMEIEKKNRLLEHQQKMIKRDLFMAEQVQKKFYIAKPPVLKQWEIAFEFRPLESVSGDLYDFYCENQELKGLSLFDVSGHGVASALVGILSKYIAQKNFVRGKKSGLDEILENVNKELIKEKGDVENYMTGVMFRFEGNNIEYINAGHPDVLIKNKDVQFFENEKNQNRGRFLGIPDLPVEYKAVKTKVEPGTYLLMYTDCLTESRNLAGDELGIELLKKVFNRSKGKTAKAVLRDILESFDAFTEAVPLQDDLTVIVLKYIG